MITAQENHFPSAWETIEKRFHCSHEKEQLVKYQQSSGQWRARRQCLNCGEYTTSDLSQHNIVFAGLPVANTTLRDSYRDAKKKAYDDARFQHLSQFEQEKIDSDRKWWANYNHYLESTHWKQLRKMVLGRDDCRCQNCFRQVTESTAHVHHLSYVGLDRVGKSFAFECVTLCAQCHIEFHPRMQYE